MKWTNTYKKSITLCDYFRLTADTQLCFSQVCYDTSVLDKWESYPIAWNVLTVLKDGLPSLLSANNH